MSESNTANFQPIFPRKKMEKKTQHKKIAAFFGAFVYHLTLYRTKVNMFSLLRKWVTL